MGRGGCLWALIASGAPRLGFILLWIWQPSRVDNAFQTWIWPILGLIFLPITTLVYVLVAPNGVTGWEWAWLVGALVADLGLTGSSVYTNRTRAGVV